jgi:PAS domain S-box-containing protein
MKYNKHLQSQLNTYLENEAMPDKYARLFKAISKSYDRYSEQGSLFEYPLEFGTSEVIAHDTDAKSEFTQLKETGEEIKTFFENIDKGFFSIDTVNSKINQISKACESIFGYTLEEFTNNPYLWIERVHPADQHLLENYMVDMAKGIRLRYRFRIIHKNNSIKWVSVKILPTLNEQKELIRMDVLFSDITGRVEAEQKIKLAEKLLLESQYVGKMGNWNLNVGSDELFWSDGFRNISGIDESIEIAPQNLTLLVHPEDKSKILKAIAEVIETGNETEVYYRNIRMNDGEERIFYSIIRSEKDKNGDVFRVYGMVQDITERRTAELKMEKLNLNMYQISHDLRGPLNSAKNFIYLALRRVSDATALDYLSKINDSYSKMEHRVLSLLDLQRINRSEVNMEPIFLPTLIHDIISTFEGLRGFNEIRIKTDIAIKSSIYSDRQFLHSIIHNLISNAFTNRKKTDEDEIIICGDLKNGQLTIKVSDNGKGIPGHIKDKMFKKFSTGDSQGGGTGLGLYIVKNLTDKLNGEISFTSQVMKGTTFTLQLPVKE